MISEKVRELLQRYVDTYHNGYCSRAAKALGVPNDTFRTWLVGTRDPLGKIGPVLDKILGELSTPEEVRRLHIVFSQEGKVEGSKVYSAPAIEACAGNQSQIDASKTALLEQEVEHLKKELAYCKEINKELFSTLQNRQQNQDTDPFRGLPLLPKPDTSVK